MPVIGAELCAVQVEFADLATRCEGAREHVNMLMVELNAAAAREDTAIGNLRFAEVARHAISRESNMARAGGNRVE